MKIYLLLLAILITSCSPNQEQVIEGDLYFKMIDILNFYTYPDSTLIEIEESCENYKSTDSIDEIGEYIQFIYDNKLLRKPRIRVFTKNKEVKTVFLEEENYSKFKDYQYSELSNAGKKIKVKLKVHHIKNNSIRVYKLLEIQSLEKVNGQTPMDK